ncbi:MAG: cupin domain-containing protein [Campylobacterota bacterium]|nr:cupin domain-containing protein [Campylobacterota bacterium]
MEQNSIFKDIPSPVKNEIFETLIFSTNIEIKRIISCGHSSPRTGWYEQVCSEWVIILQGEGKIEFENGKVVELGVGDYINIPSKIKHKVSWTTSDENTIWLAIHY